MSRLTRLSPLKDHVIYGPIYSKRIGFDIGINLLIHPRKICNFDCVYCQWGPTRNLITDASEIGNWISPELVLKELEETLALLSVNNYHLDAVTFSGFGEPTLHPQFNYIVKEAKKIKEKYYPHSKLTLLTNSTNLDKKELFESLVSVDHIIAKLDTAINKTFHEINKPSNKNLHINMIIVTLEQLAKQINHLILQILLFEADKDSFSANTSQEELAALSDAVCQIKPKEVQIYTISRAGAVDWIEPTDSDKLKELKRLIDLKCGTEVQTKIY
ncbi:MAG: radical SAM protein [Promethearchaeota archaeon]